MPDRLGAPGDFAQAYVITREIGHHVQNERDTLPKVHELRSRLSKTEANRVLHQRALALVMLELRADCLAGI